MSDLNIPTAALLQSRLEQALQPTLLEVIDESGLHAGHAGANGLGFGSHFRVRVAAPAFSGRRVLPAIGLCMMHCSRKLLPGCMHWPSTSCVTEAAPSLI